MGDRLLDALAMRTAYALPIQAVHGSMPGVDNGRDLSSFYVTGSLSHVM